jgi:hypothetical protein
VVHKCWQHDRRRPGPDIPALPHQDDRIAIADGLHASRNVKEIAADVGKS